MKNRLTSTRTILLIIQEKLGMFVLLKDYDLGYRVTGCDPVHRVKVKSYNRVENCDS